VAETDAEKKQRKYREDVRKGLDRAFGNADTAPLALDGDPVVIFSDHHRGAKDGADDFWRCQRSYHAALGYYLERGYRLVLLGDVEELWENRPEEPLAKYPETLALEAKFHDAGRLDRFWGNHDDAWGAEREVEKHLHGRFPGLVVREALRLYVTAAGERLGQIFLVHGHQGTADSDKWSAISRIPVRYLWRPIQRRFKIPSTTPSRDFKLRARHDEAMFRWALGRKRDALILIAGHTHRPVFSTPDTAPEREVEAVQEELEAARRAPSPDVERIAQLSAELELVRTDPFGESPKDMPLPCYFNTGCCSYGDGDVTGLELSDGQIRLVRWLNDKFEPRKQELAPGKDLRETFATIRDAPPVET
jgi:UDP-2,3-diacylglucosamine pyrophosphatase LpxH